MKLVRHQQLPKRHGKTEMAVLAAIGIAGVLAVAAVAPNAVRLLKDFGLLKPYSKKSNPSRSASMALRRLVSHGLVKEKNGSYELTSRGRAVLVRLSAAKGFRKEVPKKWDTKWRIVIFDVPEHKKRYRNQLRHTLVLYGFVRVQDSVWAYPYDCEDLIELLKIDLRLGKELIFIVASHLEGDMVLRQRFGLR